MKSRKMFFKLCTVILSFAMIASGCSGNNTKKTKEKVKLVIYTPPLLYGRHGGGNADTGAYTDFLEYAAKSFAAQYTEADVEYVVQGFDYVDEDKVIKQTLGTEDSPDVLFEGFFNMGSYIHSGYMVPLDDIMDDDIRSDVSERILSEGMYQGKTYMYPFYHLPNTMTYNADLFKKVGLDKYIADKNSITSWSLDDWEIILDTLAEKLPTSTFPMMMYAKNNQGDTHIMTLLRAFGCSFFTEDGKININTPEGIKALTWIQDGVKRGWFPPSSENLQLSDMLELYRNGQLAISMTNPSNMSFFEKNGIDARLVNFPSIDGKGLSTTFATGFGVFDKGDEEKVKVAKAFVKYVCSNEELQEACLPNIPARMSLQKVYKDQILMPDAYANNESTIVNFTDNLPNWTSVRAIFYPQIHDLLTGEKTPKEAAEAIDQQGNAAVAGETSTK